MPGYIVLKAREDETQNEDVVEVFDELDDDWYPHTGGDPFDFHTGAQTVGDEWGAGLFIVIDVHLTQVEIIDIGESVSASVTYFRE